MADVAGTVGSGARSVCASCGADVGADMAFCPSCGRALHDQCPQCGREVSAQMTFCPACGHQLAPAKAPGTSGRETPGYRPPPASSVRVQTNGKAIAAFVVGLVSLVTCGPVGVVAVVLARFAHQEINESDGAQGGDGLASAGLIIGAFAAVVWVLVIGGIIAVTLLGKSAAVKFSSVGSSLS